MGDAPKKVTQDEFAVRCFINGSRKPTHELTTREAKAFLVTARHLASYLCKEYNLPHLPEGADATYMRKWVETWQGVQGDVVDGILKMCNEALGWRKERDKLQSDLEALQKEYGS